MGQSCVAMLGLSDPVAEQVRAVCRALEVEVVEAAALEAPGDAPDVVLCAIERFDVLQRDRPELAVIVIADVANSQLTIDAMKRGAIECLLLPISDDTLAEQIREALDTAGPVPSTDRRMTASGAEDGIIGQSPAMQQVYKLVGLIAPRQVNVLITGESGTGKEVIARALHRHSPRAERPLLAVNCAAIPETLLESELFGHEKGAFTGADRRKRGTFEQADGGTLFLDEIGDMPLATQVKLLRVLQDHSFQRVGGSEVVTTDVRIVAATHQPLEQLIERQRFRQDLYYRLKVATIHLPPLREREVDVVLLAHYFVSQFNPQLGAHIRRFSPEAVKTLLSYDWPGNVRELENVIKASLVIARGTTFRTEFLPEHIRRATPAPTHAPTVAPGPGDLPGLRDLIARLIADPDRHGSVRSEVIQQVERVLLTAALNHTGGQLAETAALLGISRTTLRQRLRDLGITLQTVAKSAARDADGA